MARRDGGFGSLELVRADVFDKEQHADQFVALAKRQAFAKGCYVRKFPRSVHAGGTTLQVWAVVIRKKPSLRKVG